MSSDPKPDRPQVVREVSRDYGEQDAWGNSIGSLRENLKLTPLERLRKAEDMARGIQRLRNALKRTS